MRKLLIADDDHVKTHFLDRVVRSYGPEDLRNIPLVTAMTSAEAIAKIMEHPDIGAGFVDYEIPEDDGSHIIREWRRIERETGRARAYICLATNASGDTFERYWGRAKEAGADEAVSPRYRDGKSPVDLIREVLERMRPFLSPSP